MVASGQPLAAKRMPAHGRQRHGNSDDQPRAGGKTSHGQLQQQDRPRIMDAVWQQQQQQQQQGRLGARSLSGGRNSCGRTGSPLALQPLSQAERGQRPPSGGSSSVATPTSTSRRSTSQSRFAPLSLCSGGLL
mmetsp:Transcript_10909/g.29160  ORF Transcript_10909/g.29160 Transcript_10909/m.29160 type:complete len:133 (-) Transcript_10909:188-586(-)